MSTNPCFARLLRPVMVLTLGLIALPLWAKDEIKRPPAIPRRPNIILILADGLTCRDLKCYGATHAETPNLDKLAAEGVKFTRFYSGNPISTEVRECFLLGRNVGPLVHEGAGDTNQNYTTVAELLKRSGYFTGCIGKWGLSVTSAAQNQPQQQGFDEWAGYLNPAEPLTEYPTYIWRHDPVTHYDGQVTLFRNTDGKKGAPVNALFTKMAQNFMNINKPDQFNHHKPFFLFLGYTLPRSRATAAGGNSAAAVTEFDAEVGKLIARLVELKQESNTVVLVTSDDGTYQAGKEQVTARSRAPLIAWGPSLVRAGEENYQLSAAWDVLPTCLDIALTKPLEGIDGISFWPLLQGRAQLKRHEYLQWQEGEPAQEVICTGDWMAVRPQTTPPQAFKLYNLKTDADEKTDLAADHPEIVSQVETYARDSRSMAWTGKPENGKTE